MRSVSLNPTGRRVLTAGAALVLAMLAGCSSNGGSSAVTTVGFDGETYTINGQVSCAIRPDGKLLINAPAHSGGKKSVRVLVTQDPRLVVEAAGIRFLEVRGFTDDSSEMWASKVDNTYTISGRMPPENGKTAWHQFTIEVTCARVEKVIVPPQHPPRPPRLP